MIRVTALADAAPRRRSLAIGTFDGVHLGHRAVITGADTVLTFDPHPMAVLRPDDAPRLITPFELKRDLLESLGVEEMVVIPFDTAFTRTTADEFIDRIIVGKLSADRVAVGENFHFGSRATGTPDLLAADSRFETRVEPLVEVDGEPVSSTRVRRLVTAGRVAEAGRCLGTPWTFQGTVVPGDRRGRELGFPTANMVPDPRFVLPENGVYAALADGSPAAVNIGTRPTFDAGSHLLVEAFLLDRDEDLYGRELRVEFLERLRDEQRFPGSDELIAQMKRDVEATRAVCGSFQRP